MIDASIISKGLSFLLKPSFNYIGRQIVGEEILNRRQLQKTALAPILKKAEEDIAEIIEPIGVAKIEQISLFLMSSEAEAIVRQVYAVSILKTKKQNLDLIGQTFLKAFSLYTNIPEDELTDSAFQIFEFLVTGCEKALSEAIDLGILSAHEAKSQFRFQVLIDEIETIKKNLEFLSLPQKLDVPAILKFVETYRQQIAKLHGKLTPPYIDMEQKLPIDELYVSPNFSLVNCDKPDDMASLRKKRSCLKQEEDFYPSIYRTVLLGNPGGGKSTCSQKFCYDLVNQNQKRLLNGRRVTPVLIVLRDYGVRKKKNDCSLLEFIELTAKTKYQIAPPPGAFEYLLLNGYLAVNFDGLDELTDTSYRQEIRNDVELFCTLYPSVPVLVTSREIGYQEAPLDVSTFEEYRLAPFEAKQIEEYVRKWFAIDKNLSEEQRDGKVASFLIETKNLADICSNPLMLGLMCNIYKGENYIPKNRPDLYAKCAEMLFERWDRGRNIALPFLVKKIETKIRPLMRYLAQWIYGDELLQSGVSERRLIIKAADYLYPKYFEEREDAESVASAFIHFCRGRAWVFTSVGRNKHDEELYQFTHRTFLEYFTADRLVSIHRSPKDLFEVLRPRVAKQEWDVVCQLAIQIQNKQIEDAGDDLLNYLLDEIQQTKDDEQSEKWNLLHFCVRCLEFISPSVQTIRKIVTLVIERCVEIGRISFEQINSYQRLITRNRVRTGDLLSNLVKANDESIDSVVTIALEILSQKLEDLSEPDSYLAVEILEYISSSAARVGSNFKHDPLILFVDEIQTIAQQDLMTAFLALSSNIISLSNFIKWHGLESCFYNLGYRFYVGISFASFAHNTFDNLCNRVSIGDYAFTENTINEISELGKIFTTTSFPLLLDSGNDKIGWDEADFLLGNYSIHPDGVKKLEQSIDGDFNVLFGGFIILAIFIEIEIESDLEEEEQIPIDMDRRVLNDIKEHEISFFHYVRYIFLARYAKEEKHDREVTAELDRCNFSLEQRNIIWSWIKKEINLVTVSQTI